MANGIEYPLKFTADEREALQKVKRLEAELDSLKSQMKEITPAAKKAEKAILRAFEDKSVSNQVKALNKAEKAMNDYGDAARRASEATESFGDLESQTNTIRGALDTAGIGGPLGTGLQFGAEAAASVEALGRLKPALTDVAIKASESSASTKLLTSGLQSAIPGLDKSSASLATLGIAGGIAAVAMGAIAVAVRNFSEAEKELATRLNATIEARRSLSQELATGNITQEEAISRQQELQKQLEAEIALRNELTREYDKAVNQQNIVAESFIRVFSSSEQALADQIDQSTANIENYRAGIVQLDDAIERGIITASDAAAQEERLNTARIQFAQAAANVELQLLSARTQNSDAIRKQIETLRAQIPIYQEQLLATQNAGGDVSALSLRLREMTDIANRLEVETLPLVEAQEAEADAKAKAKKATEEFNQGLEETAKNVAAAVKDLAKKALEQQNALISATADYNNDIEAIQSDAYKKLADLQGKYNDGLISEAEKLADAQNDISKELSETIAELGQDAARAANDATREFQQERNDELLDAQRTERNAARDHLRRLEKIRRDAESEEEDAITNRDFRRLFEIRKQTSRELETANEEFGQERSDRQEQLNERLSDLAQAHAQEQAERQRDYQERLADAQVQAQKERQEVQQAYAEQIADLQDKHRKEAQELQREKDERIAARNQAIQEELTIIKQGHNERLEAERQFNQKMLQQAQQILGGLQSSGASSSSSLSQSGGASLAGLGGTIANTTNSTSNTTLNNTNNIQNTNPNVTGNQIAEVVTNILGAILD